MTNQTTPTLEQALKAFTYHEAVSIRKKDGQQMAPGYIMIMYGDVAFRMQSKAPGLDSYFVSICDIDEIVVNEEEPALS
jgi:hypothetical protein